MSDTPAFVRNGRLDVLAVNPLGRALYSPAFENAGGAPNLARFRFFDPGAGQFYPDFADSARITVELLRTEAGGDPFNPSLAGRDRARLRAPALSKRHRAPEIAFEEARRRYMRAMTVGASRKG